MLPFRNLKQDSETDFLGFSLADEIITKLGYVNALTVRPSSSVDKYRNQIIDPKKVANELKVDTLLTGSFIKDGDDLRITTQLIDVKPDKILMARVDRLKYDKLLTVQDRRVAADHPGIGGKSFANGSGEPQAGETDQQRRL